MPYPLCGLNLENTGEQGCDPSRGITKKIFIDLGYISEANCASETLFFDELVRKSKLSKADPQKVFVIAETQDIVDASEADKEGSLNQGFKTTLIEGLPAYKIKFFAGGDLVKRLRKLNGLTVKIREFDHNQRFWGTKSATNSVGFNAKLKFVGNKAATGQAVEEGVAEMTLSILSTLEYYDNCNWMEMPDGGNIDDAKALLDVTLKYESHASNALSYSMKVVGSNLKGGFSVGPEVGDLIKLLTFTAKSGAGTPSTSLAITSITYNATTDRLVVTYDNTAYGTATGNIMLIPPTPTLLDAGDVPETELLTVIHAKP